MTFFLLAISGLLLGQAGQAFDPPFEPLQTAAVEKPAPPRKVEPSYNNFRKWSASHTGLFFYGDFLYWKSYEEGLDFVLTGVQNVLGTSIVNFGKTFRPKFEWGPGYRVGAKYQYDRMWDLDLTWTQFQSSAFESQDVRGSGASLNPSYWSVWTAPGGLAAGVNLSLGSWRLDYWTAQLMSGVLFNPHLHFQLEPSCGVIRAYINQHFNVEYSADDGNTYNKIYMQNKYTGTGLRGAFTFSWDPLPYLRFQTEFGTALVSGKFYVTETQSNTLTYNDSSSLGHLGQTFLKVKHRPKALRTELDARAGIHTRYPFRNRFCLHLKIDWDFLVWFNQNQMLRFIGPDTIIPPQTFRGHFFPQQGDLFLQGLDISFRLEF